jgi:hypothetical protein
VSKSCESVTPRDGYLLPTKAISIQCPMSLYPPSRPNITVLLSVFFLLRGRIITGPRDIIRALTQVGLSKDPSPSELAHALQQLYVEDPDGTRKLLVPFRKSVSKVRPVISSACYSLHGSVVRFLYIPPQTLSSYRTGAIFHSSHHLHRISPMSIAISSASSWLSYASLSLHIAHPKLALSLSTISSLSCAQSLVSVWPS